MIAIIIACVLVLGIVLIRVIDEQPNVYQGLLYAGAIMAVLLLMAPLLAG